MNRILRPSLVVAAWLVASLSLPAHPVVDDMSFAAKNLLAALSATQREKATFEFKADERLNWHFIPKIRKGLTFKEMTPAQQRLAYGLLASGLSQRAYLKATTIMSLEEILRQLEGPNGAMVRDEELYYVSIFGQPGGTAPWGWRVEGHHLSLNFTVVNGELVASTPSFFGTNPAEVLKGPRAGLRVLAAEEDLGRQFVKSLTAEQRAVAVFTNVAPADIFTVAQRRVKPLPIDGLPTGRLTREQNDLLVRLVKEYSQRVRGEVADEDWQRLQAAGWDKVRFGWAGGFEKGQGSYYFVQGPTFLLEYDCTQNNANHVHAVWRNFDGDFGEDILARHRENVPHP